MSRLTCGVQITYLNSVVMPDDAESESSSDEEGSEESSREDGESEG